MHFWYIPEVSLTRLKIWALKDFLPACLDVLQKPFLARQHLILYSDCYYLGMPIDAMLITIDGSKRDQGRAFYTTRTIIADISLQSSRALSVIFTTIKEVGWQYRTHQEA